MLVSVVEIIMGLAPFHLSFCVVGNWEVFSSSFILLHSATDQDY